MSSFILSDINLFNGDLANIPETKQIIAALKAHSFIIAQEDKLFARAILNSK